jgi:hypothetical protein
MLSNVRLYGTRRSLEKASVNVRNNFFCRTSWHWIVLLIDLDSDQNKKEKMKADHKSKDDWKAFEVRQMLGRFWIWAGANVLVKTICAIALENKVIDFNDVDLVTTKSSNLKYWLSLACVHSLYFRANIDTMLFQTPNIVK